MTIGIIITDSAANPHQNPPKPFPAWRLPKGMISANDKELELSIDSCENGEWFGGALVIAGVIVGVAIAAIHPLYDSLWERWGSVISEGLVAVGVAIEIKLGQMAGLRQSELKRRSDERIAETTKIAAQATKDAADARARTAEVEKITAWRRVSEGQYLSIIDAIRDIAPEIDLLVEYERGDAEAFSYAREIAWIFEQAGVTRIRGNANSHLSPAVFGVRIASSPDIDLQKVSSAFASADIELIFENIDLSQHSFRGSTAPNFYFFVAPKKPPSFGLPMPRLRESRI